MELAEQLLQKYKNDIPSLVLLPSSGGVFEVKSDDQLIFSKKEHNRFPSFEEIEGNL